MKNNTGNSKYTNKITEIFTDPDNAIGIYEELKIGKFDEIQRVQKYERPDGRKGLALTAKTKDPKSESIKICIDIKEGHPSTAQVHELIYGAGKDSDVRFIIFSTLKDENYDDDPTTNFSLIKSIVDAKNQYPLNLYLVMFYEPKPKDNWYHYYVYTAPPEKYKYTLNELESEQTFREAEFWFVLVRSLDSDLYKDYPPPLELFDYDLGHYTQIGGLQVKAGWNDGKTFVAVFSTEDESDLVRDVWKTKESGLEKLFLGYEVDLEILGEKKPMIIVKIADLPVGWLKTDLHEKMDFARVLHRNYVKMIDFVKEET